MSAMTPERRIPHLKSPLLTDADLQEVTGLKRPSAQAKWLAAAGIQFRLRNDGTVMTTWDAVNAPLTGEQRTRPNLEAVRKAG